MVGMSDCTRRVARSEDGIRIYRRTQAHPIEESVPLQLGIGVCSYRERGPLCAWMGEEIKGST